MIAAICAALATAIVVASATRRASRLARPRRRTTAPTTGACIPLLERMAVEVRTGSSCRTALTMAFRSVDGAPAWVRAVVTACDDGAALVDALRAVRTVGGDEALLRQALVGAASMGGGSGAALDRAAAVLRDRAAMSEERRAWGAQARLSARVLTIVPVAFGGWMLVSNESTRTAAIGSPIGLAALAAGAALNATGWWWMRKIIGGRG